MGSELGRLRKIAKHRIEVRRTCIRTCPDLASETEIAALLADLDHSAQVIGQALPERLRRWGCCPDGNGANALATKFSDGSRAVLSKARLELDLTARELKLGMNAPIRQERPSPTDSFQSEAMHLIKPEPDTRRVFVVHGRNEAARIAMFTFLREMGLEPLEWEQAVALTGSAAPHIGSVLDAAFSQANAIIVLLTGDDVARLGDRYRTTDDPLYEVELTPQSRPNVLFEAGMAFGRHPDRTVLVSLGNTRPFSDIAGRHVLSITNSVKHRQAIADRLASIGCAVQIAGRTDWQGAGDFDSADVLPDAGVGAPADDDAIFYAALIRSMKATGHNVWVPDIGSKEDSIASRLAKRGWVKPSSRGYLIVRWS